MCSIRNTWAHFLDLHQWQRWCQLYCGLCWWLWFWPYYQTLLFLWTGHFLPLGFPNRRQFQRQNTVLLQWDSLSLYIVLRRWIYYFHRCLSFHRYYVFIVLQKYRMEITYKLNFLPHTKIFSATPPLCIAKPRQRSRKPFSTAWKTLTVSHQELVPWTRPVLLDVTRGPNDLRHQAVRDFNCLYRVTQTYVSSILKLFTTTKYFWRWYLIDSNYLFWTWLISRWIWRMLRCLVYILWRFANFNSEWLIWCNSSRVIIRDWYDKSWCYKYCLVSHGFYLCSILLWYVYNLHGFINIQGLYFL